MSKKKQKDLDYIKMVNDLFKFDKPNKNDRVYTDNCVHIDNNSGKYMMNDHSHFWDTDPNPTPPFTVGTGTSHPPSTSIGPITSGPISWPGITTDDQETDESGSQVIRSKAPTAHDVLVEIGKIIAKNGDIFEIRDLLQKSKIKLVDHDGEVIFDPAWRKDLKKKDF